MEKERDRNCGELLHESITGGQRMQYISNATSIEDEIIEIFDRLTEENKFKLARYVEHLRAGQHTL